MSPQTKLSDEEKAMKIANCRICLLCNSHCPECSLNWALKVIEKEEFDSLTKDLFFYARFVGNSIGKLYASKIPLKETHTFCSITAEIAWAAKMPVEIW